MDETFRVLFDARPEKEPAEDRKHADVQPQSQRKSQHGRGGEARLAADRPYGVMNVLFQDLELLHERETNQRFDYYSRRGAGSP